MRGAWGLAVPVLDCRAWSRALQTLLSRLLPSQLVLQPIRLCPCARRVAVDSQLWSVALLLARLLGDAAVSATAAAMAQQCLAEGAPLQTLLLLLGGATAEQPLAAAAAQSSGGASAAPQPPAATPWQQPGVFNPAASSSGAAGGGGGDAWRRHLAVMAANRTPGDEAAMALLGARLLAAGRLVPAHICFALAGALLQPWDLAAAAGQPAPVQPGAGGSAAPTPAAAGPPLVLLGADAAGRPRACAQLPAVLATQVYTWSRTVGEAVTRCCSGAWRGPGGGRRFDAGSRIPPSRWLLSDPPRSRRPSPTPFTTPGNTALSGAYLAVLPYKLLHAAALAELGLLPQASAYCAAIQASLQVCRAGGVSGWRGVAARACALLPQRRGDALKSVLAALAAARPPLAAPQALGSKVPPGLLVCRATAADFQDRLHKYAEVRRVAGGAGLRPRGGPGQQERAACLGVRTTRQGACLTTRLLLPCARRARGCRWAGSARARWSAASGAGWTAG